MILPNDFQRQWADTRADVMQAVEAVGESGWFVLGREVEEFEKALATCWGLPEAVGVGNGLEAIEMSLRALGCGPGDFVLTSPISAFATPLAILNLGALPVFVDCDASGMLDLAECRAVLERRPEIRFFVPVHLYGHCLNEGELAALKRDFRLKVVEDCAQSIGATFRGVASGMAGDYAATSFYPTKNLGALGDGGAVLCHTAERAQWIRQLRDYGQSAKYRHELMGYNSRLDEIQAAMLRRAFLPRLAGWTARRREIARQYLTGISNPAIEVLKAPEGSESVWHLFPVLVAAERKQAAREWFRAAGVLVNEHYPLALVEQPALEPWTGQLGSNCERAQEFCRRELSLPIHPYLTDEEVARVVEAANAWPG